MGRHQATTRATPRAGARARIRVPGPGHWRTGAGLGLLGFLLLALAAVGAGFTAQTTTAGAIAGADLDHYVPVSVTASRASPTECSLTWTAAPGTPAGIRYDVFDAGGAALASGVSGSTATVTTGPAATGLTVGARSGQWTSADRTAANPDCPAVTLSAPTALVATPGESRITVTWAPPLQDGGSSITGYMVSVVPEDTDLPGQNCLAQPDPRTCTFPGLTNGEHYTVSVYAITDDGVGPSTSTVAVPYPADLMSPAATPIWLDAQSPNTLSPTPDCTGGTDTPPTGGTRLRCWKNQGSIGGNATAAAPGNAAAYTTTAINGHPALRFDRTRPDGYAITGTGIGAVGSADRTILAVARGRSVADTGTNATAAVLMWPGGHSGMHLFGTTTGIDGVTAVGYNSSGTLVQVSQPLGNNAVAVLTGTYRGGDGSVRSAIAVDGGTAEQSVLAGTWRSYPDQVRIGSMYDTAQDFYVPLDGDIGEIIVINRALDGDERRRVEEYLARKWSSPLIPGAPQDLTPTPGDGSVNVTWNPPASDGGSPLTGYRITLQQKGSTDPARTCTTGPSGNSCQFTGLTNGLEYVVTAVAVNAVGTGLPATDSTFPYPAAIMSTEAMAVWLDALRPSSMLHSSACTGAPATAGQSVGCWRNGGYLTPDAVPDGPPDGPDLVAGAVNGRPGLRFDRTDPDQLQLTCTGVCAVWLDDRTVIAVATGRTTTDLDTNRTGTVAGWYGYHTGLYLSGLPNVDSAYAIGFNTAPTRSHVNAPMPYDTPAVLTGSFRTAAGEPGGVLDVGVAVDGRPTEFSPTPLPGPWLPSPDTLRIGSMSSAVDDWSNPLDGDIGEIIVINRSLTEPERRTVEEYLARKWGIDLAPGPPQDVTIAPGTDQATVSWTAPPADGGPAVSSYTATASPGGGSCSSAGTSCVITGLRAGGSYAVTVTATNPIGTGPASAIAASTLPARGGLTFAGDNSAALAGTAKNLFYPVTSTATDWVQLSAAYASACGLRADRSLWCWGWNSGGQLGLGDTTDRTVPERVGADTWDQVSLSGSTGCGVTRGELWCWGSNADGQLGMGDTTQRLTPTRLGSQNDWRQVSTGSMHTCAIKADDSLWCWGDSQYGKTGLGNQLDRNVPVRVGSSSWRTVNAMSHSTCGIRTDNTLWCWGWNIYGQLGVGIGEGNQLLPRQVGTDGDWSTVALGPENGCGVRTDGTLWCWGRNAFGMVGVGDTTTRDTPVQVGTETTWVRADPAGTAHTCGVRSDGSLWCWGLNHDGQLNTGDYVNSTVPVRTGKHIWSTVGVMAFGACAIDTGGRMWCGGSDGLGRDLAAPLSSPFELNAQRSWTALAAGSRHVCGTATGGEQWCWGQNAGYQVGDGTTTDRSTPQQIGAVTTWAQRTGGAAHSCAVRTDESLWCWGTGGSGQLGLGDTTTRTAPVRVATASAWRRIAAGSTGSHTCGIGADESLWCWGAGSSGQLGTGDSADRTAPVQVGAARYRSVAPGGTHTCAVRTDSTLWCWGSGANGRLGLGDDSDRNVPAQVGTDADWLTLAGGADSTCATRAGGSLWCWGSGANGRLGLGDTADRLIPTRVGLAQDWIGVSVGASHACAWRQDLSAWCWGANESGQVGDSTTTERTEPVQIGSGWQQLVAADRYTLGLR